MRLIFIIMGIPDIQKSASLYRKKSLLDELLQIHYPS